MRKISILLGVLVVMALMLSACGGAAAPATEGGAPAADTAAEAPAADPNAPTPEPTPVVNAFGQCDDPLRLWHGLTGSDGAVFAEMLQQFATDTPDLCFESQGIPWDLFSQK